MRGSLWRALGIPWGFHASRRSMTLSAGARLGPYEILSLIGVGGMGEVYTARDTRLDRAVAVKVLLNDLVDRPDRRRRFETEARAISSLHHPHICTLFDVGEQDGIAFFVMEYLEGETLDDRLTRGPLPAKEMLAYASQIADALDHAHRERFVHRDLKPSNVMLTPSGAKLLDFGLVRRAVVEPVAPMASTLSFDQRKLTAEGTILGTFQYMAPEQLEGKEADARTDIFALGTLMFEMATGQKAFEGSSQASLIASILTHQPPAVSSARHDAGLPQALDHIIERCLAKNPVDRWQTARDVKLELEWIAGGSSQATRYAVTAALAPARSDRLGRGRPGDSRRSGHRGAAERSRAASGGCHSLRRRAAVRNPHRRFRKHNAYGALPRWPTTRVRRNDQRPATALDPLAGVAGGAAAGGNRRCGVSVLVSGQPLRRLLCQRDAGELKKVDVIRRTARGPFAQREWRGSLRGAATEPFSSLSFWTGSIACRVKAERRRASRLWTRRDVSSTTTGRASCLTGGDFMYLATALDANGVRVTPSVYVASLDSTDVTLLAQMHSKMVYAPPGYLLFVEQGALLAQTFDAATLEAALANR